MFKIAFYLFDYKDGSFKKVYFHHWNDSKPVFTKNKRRAQEYFDERSANKDIVHCQFDWRKKNETKRRILR